ncbi:MAG: glycosyltransferase family 4 protein [Halolamina sp.]
MPRILLLHTNRAYAETLAAAVTENFPSFEVDVVSRVSVWDRIRALVRADYDLVQADELMVNGVLAAGGSLLRRVPLIVAIRGWADYTNAHGQYGLFKQTTISARTRLVLGKADEVIFLSETTRERFREIFPIGRSSIVGRPIDTDRFDDGKQIERPTFDLLTVTNLRYERKYDGIITILEALDPLFAAHSKLRLRIAGDGRYLPELERYLERYAHPDRVDALGFVDDVEDEFASADAFVYVSFLDAYPTVVLEAQAAGLPVIGGDAVGIPAVVGEAGEIVDPDPTGVRAALEQVYLDEEYRKNLAEDSLEKMKTYNEECAAGHVEVWNRAISD